MKDKQYRVLQENFKKFLYEENQVQVPAFLYHIAKAADEQVIKQQGLIANTGDATDTDPGRIYFSETLPAATQRYKKFLQTDPSYQGAVCFKIDTGKLEAVPFFRDYKNGGIYTTADIPKEAIASVSRFGTTQMANEMAIAPQDVKVFTGQNYSSAKIANRIEKLIDESVQYLNSGKKGKKPMFLDATSASQDKINLKFKIDKNTTAADPELNSFYTITYRHDMYRDETQFRKLYPREYSAWKKIDSILDKKYMSAGWSVFDMTTGRDAFYVTLKK